MSKKTHRKTALRLKALGGAVGGLAGGILLIYLHTLVLERGEAVDTVDTAMASAAQEQPIHPTEKSPAEDVPSSEEQRRAIAQNMSSLLLMLGLVCLVVTAMCVGWVVWDVYHSQPAWKTQTKYPRRH
jgi:hypothetical protein